MKRHLLFLLLAAIIGLPASRAQLLTEVQDSSTIRIDRRAYFKYGGGIRITTGYQQMRDFYKEQGFEDVGLNDFVSIGYVFPLKGKFDVELNMDLPFLSSEFSNVNLGNDRELSLTESQYAFHLLPGYRFWQGRYTSLVFHTGLTFQLSRAEMVERLSDDLASFDFSTGNISTPRGTRSIPLFFHFQGALHAAVTLKLSYPGSRRFRADQEIKLGFVSALNDRQWLISPGEGVNVPTDKVQYIYISGVFHFDFK